MALLMVHLLAADDWALRHSLYYNSPEYYLGSISPDAIHVRDHDDKSHKNEIHLQNWICFHEEPVLTYWRDHHSPFDIGYGIHVLTDAQWVPRYRTKYPQLLLSSGMVKKELYYQETYATDYELFRNVPRLRELFQLLMAAEVPADHPLLTASELDGWRQWMWGMYTGDAEERQPAQMLNTAYVLDFIRDAQPLMDRVYQHALLDQ